MTFDNILGRGFVLGLFAYVLFMIPDASGQELKINQENEGKLFFSYVGKKSKMSNRIESLTVNIIKSYAYRDWMPIVLRPGPDGGSPLFLGVAILLHNQGKSPLCIEKDAYIETEEGGQYPIMLENLSEGPTWPVNINAGQTIQTFIGTRSGPYLPVGSQFHLIIRLVANSGETTTVRIPDIVVGKTS
ncbi:MAG: hypothetical protein BA864_07255 [Desulfuromonadales bacterium C00003093]|nr:MAG: hypothetical protein BA864_07255 [Desulfuromonadales bacterium C00003093]